MVEREIDYSNRFKKNYRLAERRGKNMDKLEKLIDLLRTDQPLDARYRPHPLRGDWNHHMECHVEPDWLLIYKVSEDTLYLAATGTHSDLFDE